MSKTGIFATEEEFQYLMKRVQIAENTPVIALSLGEGLAGRDFAALAHRSVQEVCHALALQHGLPEICGFYGVNQDREFIRV